MHVKGTITFPITAAAAAAANNGSKNVIIFIDWVIKINSTLVDNAQNIDIVMPMHNLIKYIAIITGKHVQGHGHTVEVSQL